MLISINSKTSTPTNTMIPLFGCGMGDKILIMMKCNRMHKDTGRRFILSSNISNDNSLFYTPRFVDSFIGVDVSKVPGFPNVNWEAVLRHYASLIPYEYTPLVLDHLHDGMIVPDDLKELFVPSKGHSNAAELFWDINDLHGQFVITCHIRRLAHGVHQEVSISWWAKFLEVMSRNGIRCILLVDTLYEGYTRMFGNYPVIPLIYSHTSMEYIYAVINKSRFFIGTDTGISWLAATTKAIPIILLYKEWLGGMRDIYLKEGTTILAPFAMDSLIREGKLSMIRPRVTNIGLDEAIEYILCRV